MFPNVPIMKQRQQIEPLKLYAAAVSSLAPVVHAGVVDVIISKIFVLLH